MLIRLITCAQGGKRAQDVRWGELRESAGQAVVDRPKLVDRNQRKSWEQIEPRSESASCASALGNFGRRRRCNQDWSWRDFSARLRSRSLFYTAVVATRVCIPPLQTFQHAANVATDFGIYAQNFRIHRRSSNHLGAAQPRSPWASKREVRCCPTTCARNCLWNHDERYGGTHLTAAVLIFMQLCLR
jgi:hypothetical protein